MNDFISGQSTKSNSAWLPKINVISKNDREIIIEAFISKDLPFFIGHFPELAILPGVMQIDWVMQLSMAHWPDLGQFSGMDNLRFVKPILPGHSTILNIQRNSQHISFSWLTAENNEINSPDDARRVDAGNHKIQCSSGRIRFVAT